MSWLQNVAVADQRERVATNGLTVQHSLLRVIIESSFSMI